MINNIEASKIHLKESIGGWSIECVDEIASTNTELLSRAKSGRILQNTLLQADTQTSGRGTHGRCWYCVAESLTFSLAVPTTKNAQDWVGFSIVVGRHIVQALRDNAIAAKLKWPNDITVDEKKLAGILIESVKAPNGQLILVIGIGINLRRGNTRIHTDYDWIALDETATTETDKAFWLTRLSNAVIDSLLEFNSCGIEQTRADWDKISLYENGCPVNVSLDNGDVFQATVLGLGALGQLVLKQGHQIRSVINARVRKLGATK